MIVIRTCVKCHKTFDTDMSSNQIECDTCLGIQRESKRERRLERFTADTKQTTKMSAEDYLLQKVFEKQNKHK